VNGEKNIYSSKVEAHEMAQVNTAQVLPQKRLFGCSVDHQIDLKMEGVEPLRAERTPGQ